MPQTRLFKRILSSGTLNYVFWLAMFTGIYALVPVLLHRNKPDLHQMSSSFHAVLSLILGWLLVFRTNTSYSRWWEARTLWGGLVNTSRNTAIKFCNIGSFSEEQKTLAEKLIKAFPFALKWHLRSEDTGELPEEVKQLVQNKQHRPQAIANQLYGICRDAKTSGVIDSNELRIMDAELSHLMNICGACERILKTRIVRSYRIFARQCILAFLATLPWGLVVDFEWWTILITIISAYFMLGLETVAEHVEEPFGYDDDDLDLDGLCETIEITVHEVFENGPKDQSL